MLECDRVPWEPSAPVGLGSLERAPAHCDWLRPVGWRHLDDPRFWSGSRKLRSTGLQCAVLSGRRSLDDARLQVDSLTTLNNSSSRQPLHPPSLLTLAPAGGDNDNTTATWAPTWSTSGFPRPDPIAAGPSAEEMVP